MNRISTIFALFLTIGMLVGCGKGPDGTKSSSSHLSQESFLKIQDGMYRDDVRMILGNPTKRLDGADLWQEGPISISVYYDGDRKVERKVQYGLTDASRKK